MKSDYGQWFVSKDGSETAILCKRDKLFDHLKDVFGAAKAASLAPLFRRATLAEHCRYELAMLDTGGQ